MAAQLRLIADTGSLSKAPQTASINLGLLTDQRAQLSALAAFYRAHRNGLEANEAMRLALEAARDSAVARGATP